MSFVQAIKGAFHQAGGKSIESASPPTNGNPWDVHDLLTNNKLSDIQVRARLDNLAKLSGSNNEVERYEANKAYREITKAYLKSGIDTDGYTKATEPIRKIIKVCQKKLMDILKGHVGTGKNNVVRKKQDELKNSLQDMPDCELWLAFNGPWGKNRRNRQKTGFPDREKALSVVKTSLKYTRRLADTPILVTNELGNRVDSGKKAEFQSKEWILNKLPEKLHPQEVELLQARMDRTECYPEDKNNEARRIIDEELLSDSIARETAKINTLRKELDPPLASDPADNKVNVEGSVTAREMSITRDIESTPPLDESEEGGQTVLSEVAQDVSSKVDSTTVESDTEEETETPHDGIVLSVQTNKTESGKVEHSLGSKDPNGDEIEYSISISEQKRRALQFGYTTEENESEYSMSHKSDMEKDTEFEVEKRLAGNLDSLVEPVEKTAPIVPTTSIDKTSSIDTLQEKTSEQPNTVEQTKAPVKRVWWRRALDAIANTGPVKWLAKWFID